MEFNIHAKDADKEQAFKNLSKNKKLKIKPLRTQEKKATFEHFKIHAKDTMETSSFEELKFL